MNENIIRFFGNQTCATLCCIDEAGNPYCFSCYYVFNGRHGVLYFKSSTEAHHSALLAKNPVVAGTILPDKLNKLISQGIQLQGEMLEDSHLLAKDAYMLYHKKFPMALAIAGKVFTVRLNCLKMTDSSKIFGKKRKWNRAERTNEPVIV
jgi:uncharacterized protein YhbP (UPF0306 family)